MYVDVVSSSRELFGSDRSAVRTALALVAAGFSARLVLPAHRQERGLRQLAEASAIPVVEGRFAVATSRGIEGASTLPLAPWPDAGLVDAVVLNTSAVILPRAAPRRRVLVIREWLKPSSPAHRALALMQSARAQFVVAVSHQVLGQYRACGGSVSRSDVVWNWLSPEWLADVSVATEHTSQGRILCVGRFNSWKGQEVLADAYDQAFGAANERPSLAFLGAQSEDYRAKADSLESRAAERGWAVLPVEPDPRPVYRASNLVVVPSVRPEPFGNVVLEGLATGCRVLAFEGGGPSDLTPLFPGNLITVERSTEALARSLESWWRLGGRGITSEDLPAVRETLLEQFSAERAAMNWRRVLESL